MAEQFVIRGRWYRDKEHTQALPSLIGPFASRDAAEAWLDAQEPLWGSGNIAPLMEPSNQREDSRG